MEGLALVGSSYPPVVLQGHGWVWVKLLQGGLVVVGALAGALLLPLLDGGRAHEVAVARGAGLEREGEDAHRENCQEKVVDLWLRKFRD